MENGIQQAAGVETMTINESRDDRIIRVIVATVLIGLGGVGILSLFGLVALVTGLVGFCPLYRMLGISTCPQTS